MEHRVGRQRAARVDPGGAESRDRRADHGLVLLAQRAALAGVGIETGDRQTRRRRGEAPAELVGDDGGGLDDEALGERRGDLAERDVDGDRNGLQVRAGEHHHRPRRRAGPRRRQRAQELGVAGMAEAGVVERLLGDRVGDDGAGEAGADIADGARDRLDHGLRILGIGGARRCIDRGV